MECRSNCGACCIAPSISSALPDMPDGKPAGMPCVHLDEQRRCKIFGLAVRPAVCGEFLPDPGVCGDSAEEALQLLQLLERSTADW